VRLADLIVDHLRSATWTSHQAASVLRANCLSSCTETKPNVPTAILELLGRAPEADP
jgi:hypothetical protein